MSHSFEIGKRIYEHAQWLEPSLLQWANEALGEFEHDRFRDAAGKAGNCMEGVLKELLDGWQVQYGRRASLGELIGTVRDTQRLPESLDRRLSEANTIRIRAAHHAPDDWQQVTDGDALLILNVLDMLIAWGSQHHATVRNAGGDLPVFFSVGSVHRLDQERFLQQLRNELGALNVELRNSSYAKRFDDRAVDKVVSVMKGCRGVLVVGLERSHAYAVFERERSRQEKVYSNQYVPTAWNQIEGAFAVAFQLPLLVLRDARLQREGIFEGAHHGSVIKDFSVEDEARGLSRELRSVVAAWVRQLRDGASPA